MPKDKQIPFIIGDEFDTEEFGRCKILQTFKSISEPDEYVYLMEDESGNNCGFLDNQELEDSSRVSK